MPDININGDNNRTAGRDYYEHPPVCPYCEERLLLQGREYCQHCEHEYYEMQRIEQARQLTERRLFKLLMVIFCIFFISALVLHYGPEEWKFTSSFAVLFSLFGCGAALTARENYSKKKFYSS